MTNRDRLITLATALYGERWRHAVGRDLGLDEKQIRRWDSGRYSPSDEHVRAMLTIAQKRLAAIHDAILACDGLATSDQCEA